MTALQFKEIISSVPHVDSFHNTPFKCTDNYIVWAEVSKTRLKVNNKTRESNTRFAVDFFTTEEYSDIPSEIERILEDNDLLITDYQVDFEKETKLNHYAYTVEG